MAITPTVTVSGFGRDEPAPGVGPAVSRAQNIAVRATDEGSVYVRQNGETVVRVDRDRDGVVFTYRIGGSK